jgi:hypothetical protein
MGLYIYVQSNSMVSQIYENNSLHFPLEILIFSNIYKFSIFGKS